MSLVSGDPDIPLGIRIVGTAPTRTSDWMRALVDVVTYVAVADALRVSMLYAADPQEKHTNDVHLVRLLPVAPALDLGKTQIPTDASALIMLHPPGQQDFPDLEEPDSHPVATGTLILPGVPQIGLDHRAAWAAVDTVGRVAHMRFTTHARMNETVDVALLATLLP